MTISFIICTYNREKYIYECLSRLAKNTVRTDWEIVLVDNNSTDSTASECNRFHTDFPSVNYRYFLEKQQGLSFARNHGIQEAKGDWLVFLDDDAFVEPDYIKRLQQHIQNLPDMAAFGGKILPLLENGHTPEWLGRWTMIWLSALDMGSRVKRFTGKQYPIGANMGIARKTAEQIGFFDTNLGRKGKNFIGGEEKDYFSRIKRFRQPVYYLPDIAVRHCIPASRTTDDYIRKLGRGTGASERLRTRSKGATAYAAALLKESFKWLAILLLCAGYILTLHPVKGTKLILFRAEVTKGLLEKETD